MSHFLTLARATLTGALLLGAAACEGSGTSARGDAASPSHDAGNPFSDAPTSDGGTSFDAHAAHEAGFEVPDATGEGDASNGDSGDPPSDPAALDGGADGAAGPMRENVRPFVTGPTYLGTAGLSSACTQSYRTTGFVPDDAPSKHPLFLYFAGTAGGAADNSALYDSQAAARVNQAMAARGFVALAVEYDNTLGSFFTNKLPCLYGPDNPQSLLARACALPEVDCVLGIATWGHSQGAMIAHAAANYDVRVRAVWTAGYSGLAGASLPFDRLRTVNGEGEPMNSNVATANKTVGLSPAEQCPDDGRDQCLRDDGSGWIIVRKSACKRSNADHCWFNKTSCASNDEVLEPNWVDRDATTPFALEANADWVAQTVRR